MRTNCKLLLVLAGSAGLLGAEAKPKTKNSPQPTPAVTSASPGASSAKPAAASGPRVIGYIEKRRETITIKSGPKAPMYSVKTADGKVLFENLSADQLQARAPELHEFLKSAVAEKGDARVRARMDARY
jgi:hypothetical protein